MTDLLSPWTRPRAAGQPLQLAVGVMNFGTKTPEAEAHAIVDRALERGLHHFDTANVYGEGESERILGRALKGRRDQVVIASKVGIGTMRGKAEGLAPKRIRQAIDESRERLGVDTIDLYYLHKPDRSTPIEATLEVLAELTRAQKIRAYGFSNYGSWETLEAIVLADRHGYPRPVIGQVLYNVLIREVEIEYLRFAARFGLHTTVYNPLAGGLLAGHYATETIPSGSRFDQNPMYQRRYWTERGLDHVGLYRQLATEAGMSVLELAYRWLASRPGVDSILLGPRTVAHLDAAIDACAGSIEPALIAQVDTIHRAFLGTDTHYVR